LTIVAPSGSITDHGPASIEKNRQHLHQPRMVHDSMSLNWKNTKMNPPFTNYPHAMIWLSDHCTTHVL